MADEQLDNQEVPQEKTYSPIEVKALEMGWRPKEEWEGAEEDFVDAKEYVGRKPLFDRIHAQSQEIKEVNKKLAQVQKHIVATTKSSAQQRITALKQARAAALNEGDGNRFEQVDEEIKRVEKHVSETEELDEPVPTVPQEFLEWQNQNSWYTSTKYMRDWADDYGMRLHAQGLSPADVLKELSKAVKKEFPHKFYNPNKESAPPIGEGKSGNSKPSGNSSLASREANLSEMEKRTMDNFVRNKVMTKEEYLTQLVELDKAVATRTRR